MIGVVLGTVLLAHDLRAQRANNEPLEEIIVSVTPVRNAGGLPNDKIAYNVQSASSKEIERMQSLHLADFLNRTMESVSINGAQNNPLQPDVRYRGFAASPLLGLPQGLAVYQNGVRINEPFGDTVNWDLLAQSAIYSVQLISGANPLFGLNTLGGALSLEMKNGFNAPGHHLQLEGGSFGRAVVSLQSGGSREDIAWYGNVHYFDENGWRDASPSDAVNLYGSLGWRGDATSLNVNSQYGRSDLVGNGAVPVELLRIERDAIFTAPDITGNEMAMLTLDGSRKLSGGVLLSGNAFYRRNETDSFNGDSSDFTLCRLGGADALLEGLDDEALEELGFNNDDICNDRFPDIRTLEMFLNGVASARGAATLFRIEDLSGNVSGTGVLSDSAINNISSRLQRSYGADVQLSFASDFLGWSGQVLVGTAWFRGTSRFDALLELASLNPVTRSTVGLGTGAFLDEAATSVSTESDTLSVYLSATLDVGDKLALTLSGRFNDSRISLDDRSGERPELEGRHRFRRFNPAIGLTYRFGRHVNAYASYSESSRTPTPIELACNDAVFERAAAIAAARGEDPGDVDFECRLPNAFLADPPLQQVVARSYEAGLRFDSNDTRFHAGLFHTANSDDIIFQTTGRATGLFANVDKTLRMGIESGINGSWRGLDWFVAYSYVEATFDSALEVLSPNHPSADEESGAIRVRAGDRIPGIPKHHLKFGGDYQVSESLSVGLDVLSNSGQYLRGDESMSLSRRMRTQSSICGPVTV